MESKILQKIQQDYPSVPADVAAVVASLIEKGPGRIRLKPNAIMPECRK